MLPRYLTMDDITGPTSTRKRRKQSGKKRFEEFYAANPKVYELFVKYARRIKTAGLSEYSARDIMGRVRWEFDINSRWIARPRVPNYYAARYARKLMADHPGDFKGFFKLKKP